MKFASFALLAGTALADEICTGYVFIAYSTRRYYIVSLGCTNRRDEKLITEVAASENVFIRTCGDEYLDVRNTTRVVQLIMPS